MIVPFLSPPPLKFLLKTEWQCNISLLGKEAFSNRNIDVLVLCKSHVLKKRVPLMSQLDLETGNNHDLHQCPTAVTSPSLHYLQSITAALALVHKVL